MSATVRRHIAHLAVALLGLTATLARAVPAWAKPAPYQVLRYGHGLRHVAATTAVTHAPASSSGFALGLVVVIGMAALGLLAVLLWVRPRRGAQPSAEAPARNAHSARRAA